jgi:Ribosome-binding factor A
LDDIRRKRVEDELRDMIAQLIIGGQVKDPRVGPFVSVTRVEAARDLSYAKVYVSVFPGTEEEKPSSGDQAEKASGAEGGPSRLDLAVDGLQRASGFIQAQLGKRLKTRLTPHLTFVADVGIEKGFELSERMKGLFS